MPGLLWSGDKLGQLPHERPPRKQCRCCEECVDLVRHLLFHATHWSILGRHILGKILDSRNLHLILCLWDARPHGFSMASTATGFTQRRKRHSSCRGVHGALPCRHWRRWRQGLFGTDQFDSTDPAERVRKGSFFNWFFFSINMGSLLSSTVLVWVQENIGWGVGFAIPMVLTLFSLTVFVAGRKVYRDKKLEGSPLTSVSQVVVAAVRNYHLTLPEDASALHEAPSPNEANCKIAHTCQFRFFDKAAIAVPPSSGEKSAVSRRSPWRLCTVSQVEELKMLLRMFPVWASTMLFFAVTAQKSSTFIEQGMVMDKRVGPFTVPPASLATFHTLTIVAGIPVYDALVAPLARRVTGGDDRGLTPQLQRLGVGLALSVAAMAYAALVEARAA